jgi:hypothetical protein
MEKLSTLIDGLLAKLGKDHKPYISAETFERQTADNLAAKAYLALPEKVQELLQAMSEAECEAWALVHAHLHSIHKPLTCDDIHFIQAFTALANGFSSACGLRRKADVEQCLAILTEMQATLRSCLVETALGTPEGNA